MNANELAGLIELAPDYIQYRQEAATMLRKQQLKIDNLLENNARLDAEIEVLKSHPVKEQDGCGNCHACLVGVMEHGLPVTSQRMILCPDCGNKRCPKASNHRYQCTNSNEPNQRGSIYTHPAELTDEAIEECYWGDGYPDNPRHPKEFAYAILRKAKEK